MAVNGLRGTRIASAVAFVGIAALALAGCTTGGSGEQGNGGDDTTTGGTITIATTNAFTSFNGDTPEANLDTNGMVGYLTGVSGGLGLGGFLRLDSDYSILTNDDFGTYEKVSEDPLTVQYTLKEGLKWSDGEPITADDMLVNWVINSGWFNDAVIDPATGDVTNGGTQYFSLAGSTAGLDTTAFPEISDDNLSMTLTYSTPYVDWELVNPIGKPAHVLADKAGVSLEEFITLINDSPQGDVDAPAAAPIAELKAAADFWNTGYDVTAMPTDESLLVGSGPFIVTGFTPESDITLEKNPEYTGSLSPAYDQLIIRFIGDANAQVTALDNGDVDAIYPQPSADTLTALDNAGAVVHAGDQLSYDHIDLNFTGVFADANVREAFMKTVPRQQILESIITPINPEAGVLNSQIFLPTDADYADAVASSGYDQYDEPDIEGAKALLAGATPTVRILYNTNNPNRVDSFRIIQQSAEQAGFIIEDAGSPDWGSLLGSGSYDAAIFGWISPGAGNAALPQIFQTNGGGNYNGYSNPAVDEMAIESQIALDPARLIELKIGIDTETAKDFYGLPLFQLPGLFADNGAVTGLEYFGGQTGIVWNAQEWTLAG